MKIYEALILKRTAVEKRVYDESLKREVLSTFAFSENHLQSFHSTEQQAKDTLLGMIEDSRRFDGIEWGYDNFNYMFGKRSKYHSEFTKDKCGNKIDYFALINEHEVV